MTQAVIPFAFEDHLVRSVIHDGQPWFVAIDVCRALDLKGDAGQHTRRLDHDEVLTLTIADAPSISDQGQAMHGGVRQANVISEPGVYRLVFTSRKPSAERFKRWLAHDVLPALRRDGRYQVREPDGAPEEAEPLQAYALKLQTVREARLIYGPQRAQALWSTIGLPAVPNPYPAGHDEPFRALDMLTRATRAGATLRELLISALDGTDEPSLPPAGLRALPERREPAIAVWPQGDQPRFYGPRKNKFSPRPAGGTGG
jgi:prophage antirepressor-like protein